ncbi:MT-A70-domain-containing protein, partial [Morchella snyderi]
FDFALLDPPWPNRSAARSAAYSTLSSRPGGGGGGGGIHELLQLPLGPALAPGALVAVWITNKPRHRAFVVERLFARWGVVEAGEWVWLKVTGGGEPVVALEAAMRKPYEVLVFGRKPAGGGEEEAGEGGGVGVGRVPPMTIVAVPDLHSRKPGVKELVEPYLPEDYRACEIFGRNLTEGWFTWGDEAIKFNWDGHWKPEAAEGAPTTTTTASSSSGGGGSSTATAAENGDGGDGDEMTDE